MDIKVILSYLVARLTESSSWATILAFVSTQFHLHTNPDFNTWVTQLGVCLATGLGILIKEGWKSNESK